MKELLFSIYQESGKRFNTPIVSSFIISWVVINYKIILEFFFSTPDKKILLLNSSYEFWNIEPSIWSCPPMLIIVYPILASLFYIFIIPLAQYHIDIIRFSIVDSKRIQKKTEDDLHIYGKQKEVSRAKAEASDKYCEEKLSRELDDWSNQKTKLLAEVSTLKDDIILMRNGINASNKEKTKLMDEKDKLRKEISDIKRASLATENELNMTIESDKKQIKSYEDNMSFLKSEYEKISHFRDKYRSSMKLLAESKECLNVISSVENETYIRLSELCNTLLSLKSFYEIDMLGSDNESKKPIVYERQDLLNIIESVLKNLQSSKSLTDNVENRLKLRSFVNNTVINIDEVMDRTESETKVI
ncbi:hypothetical protein ACI1G2_001580 [Vibrio fluvialis]